MIGYLDMDGVCVNFMDYVLEQFGFDMDRAERTDDGVKLVKFPWTKEPAITIYPYGEWDIAKALGITVAHFWQTVDRSSVFCLAEPYAWFDDLIRLMDSSFEKWYFLTSPSQNPNCLSDKLRWLHNYYNDKCRNYIITPHKHLFANSDAVLIDDSDSNVRSFQKAGGNIILFPQFWNSSWDYTGDKIEYVRTAIASL